VIKNIMQIFCAQAVVFAGDSNIGENSANCADVNPQNNVAQVWLVRFQRRLSSLKNVSRETFCVTPRAIRCKKNVLNHCGHFGVVVRQKLTRQLLIR
jgi:hypothetical protein